MVKIKLRKTHRRSLVFTFISGFLSIGSLATAIILFDTSVSGVLMLFCFVLATGLFGWFAIDGGQNAKLRDIIETFINLP